MDCCGIKIIQVQYAGIKILFCLYMYCKLYCNILYWVHVLYNNVMLYSTVLWCTLMCNILVYCSILHTVLQCVYCIVLFCVLYSNCICSVLVNRTDSWKLWLTLITSDFSLVHCLTTVHNSQSTIHSIQYTIHGIQYTIYGIQYTIHGIQHPLHSLCVNHGLQSNVNKMNGISAQPLTSPCFP